MNILIAPDKFKGSLRADEVCDAISQGIRSLRTDIEITCLPLADGGEGTCELLTTISRGKFVTTVVRDPLFRSITSGYGISSDGATAFIEMAKASGLILLSPGERNPSLTSTAGTGDLIRAALEAGVTQIILGIGGSATNDGGMGAADALGVQFFSKDGSRLKPVGASLGQVYSIDVTQVHKRLPSVPITILCDVDNPLYGQDGAAFVFARQKGADDTMIRTLDEGLKHFASVLEHTFQKPTNFPGAGAAGGIAVALSMIAPATIRRGMEFIAAFTGLEEAIRKADLVITGEGKIDQQTLSGKVVKSVASLAQKAGKPVIAFAGKCELGREGLSELGIEVKTLASVSRSENEAMTHAFSLLKTLAADELRDHLNH